MSNVDRNNSFSANSSVATCATDTRDRNDFTSPETLAVRFTPQGINELMGLSIDYSNEPHWQVITHFIYHCLNINMSGDVTFGCPILFRGSEDIENLAHSTLQNPETYIPVIESLVENNPQMNVAFSLPVCEENVYLKDTISKFSLQILTSLKKLVLQNKCVNLIEIDSCAFDLLVTNETHWALISEIPVKWLVTLLNNEPLSKTFSSKIIKLKTYNLLEAMVIKSFGHLRIARCPTSHGTYQSMILHPESSLSDFKSLFNIHSDYLPPEFILMDIDTCGVEFKRSASHGVYVDKFRLTTLKEIRQLRNFGKKTYYENYDAENGCSMLEFLQENSAISYDNEQVRTQKIDFIIDNNLKGVVLGELQNDLPPNHNLSLFSTYLNKIIAPVELDA